MADYYKIAYKIFLFLSAFFLLSIIGTVFSSQNYPIVRYAFDIVFFAYSVAGVFLSRWSSKKDFIKE